MSTSSSEPRVIEDTDGDPSLAAVAKRPRNVDDDNHSCVSSTSSNAKQPKKDMSSSSTKNNNNSSSKSNNDESVRVWVHPSLKRAGLAPETASGSNRNVVSATTTTAQQQQHQSPVRVDEDPQQQQHPPNVDDDISSVSVDEEGEDVDIVESGVAESLQKLAREVTSSLGTLRDAIAAKQKQLDALQVELNRVNAERSQHHRELSDRQRKEEQLKEQIRHAAEHDKLERHRAGILANIGSQPQGSVSIPQYPVEKTLAIANSVAPGLHVESRAGGVPHAVEDLSSWSAFTSLLEEHRHATFLRGTTPNERLRFMDIYLPNRRATGTKRHTSLVKCLNESSGPCTMSGCRYQHNDSLAQDVAAITDMTKLLEAMAVKADGPTKLKISTALSAAHATLEAKQPEAAIESLWSFLKDNRLYECVPGLGKPTTTAAAAVTQANDSVGTADGQHFTSPVENWFSTLKKLSREKSAPQEVTQLAKLNTESEICGRMSSFRDSCPNSVVLPLVQLRLTRGSDNEASAKWPPYTYALTDDVLARCVKEGAEIVPPCDPVRLPTHETFATSEPTMVEPSVYIEYLAALSRMLEAENATIIRLSMVCVCDRAVSNLHLHLIENLTEKLGSASRTCGLHIAYFIALRTLLLLGTENEVAAVAFLRRVVVNPGEYYVLPCQAQYNLTVLLLAILTNSLGADVHPIASISYMPLMVVFDKVKVEAMSSAATAAVRSVLSATMTWLAAVAPRSLVDEPFRKIASSCRHTWLSFELLRGGVPPKDIAWQLGAEQPHFIDFGFLVRTLSDGNLPLPSAVEMISKAIHAQGVDTETMAARYAVLRMLLVGGHRDAALAFYRADCHRFQDASPNAREQRPGEFVSSMLDRGRIPHMLGKSSKFEKNVSAVAYLALGEQLEGRKVNARRLLDHALEQPQYLETDDAMWLLADRMCLGMMDGTDAKFFKSTLTKLLSADPAVSVLDATMHHDVMTAVLLGANAVPTGMQVVMYALSRWTNYLCEGQGSAKSNMLTCLLFSVSNARHTRMHPVLAPIVHADGTVAGQQNSVHALPMPQPRSN
eukprot:PhM_4_TR5790/c0_g3_i1/m.67504